MKETAFNSPTLEGGKKGRKMQAGGGGNSRYNASTSRSTKKKKKKINEQHCSWGGFYSGDARKALVEKLKWGGKKGGAEEGVREKELRFFVGGKRRAGRN